MNQFCEITPELRRLAAKSAECSKIDPELYTRYDVKRGLRDLNGKGVLVGLTEISEVSSKLSMVNLFPQTASSSIVVTMSKI